MSKEEGLGRGIAESVAPCQVELFATSVVLPTTMASKDGVDLQFSLLLCMTGIPTN